MKQTDAFSLEEVKNIQTEIACAELQVVEADVTEITVTVDGMEDGDYKCDRAGDVLRIFHEPYNHKMKKHDETVITLELPRMASFDSFTMELGAGAAEFFGESITYRRAEMEVGAGKISSEHLNVLENFKISVGAGKANLRDVEAGNMQIECGVGTFSLEGKVGHNIDVGCGVGKVDLTLANQAQDFNYDISSAIGKVIINGNSYGKFAQSSSISNSTANGTLTIENGIGKVSVQTA